MVLPLILAGVGGMLPGIISAIAGSKTQEQARVAVQPEYDAMVTQMIGRGMKRAEAEAEADNAIQGEVASKMQEGALPPWAENLLTIAGGLGGWIAGGKLAARSAAKALGKTAKEAPAVPAVAVPAVAGNPRATPKQPPPVPDAYKRDAPSRAKMAENDVNAEAARAGRFDRVNPTAESGGAVIPRDADATLTPPFRRAAPPQPQADRYSADPARSAGFGGADDLVEPFRRGRIQPRLGRNPELL